MPDVISDYLTENYLTEKQLAEQLGRDVRTLQRWRWSGEGPPVTKFGRKVTYRIDGVRDWLKARERQMPRERAGRRNAERRDTPAA